MGRPTTSFYYGLLLCVGICANAGLVQAQALPGPADVGRIKPEQAPAILNQNEPANTTLPKRTALPILPMPKNVKDIHLHLEAGTD